MKKDIVITGMGMVSAIGLSVSENLESLLLQRSGIAPIQYLSTRHKGTFLVGEVKLSNNELLQRLEIAIDKEKDHTRTSLLSLMAAQEAVKSSGWKSDWANQRVGFISATTVGGMDKTENHYAAKNFKTGYLKTHPSGDATDVVAQCLGIHHYRTTVSTACSSAANAMIHGARLIQQGIIDVAVVGGVDPLSRFTLNGFNSLMILDKEWSKPFDKNRNGLNLGEGAGFFVIESKESAVQREANIVCKLAGYANANDAYHQTASSPDGEGATMAMRKAIAMSGLSISDIDYINVHGTGTNNNDLSEGGAIKNVFGDEVPLFSSTKSYTGHTLGAAAALEAVYSILALQNGVIFPNLNFSDPIEELNMAPVTELQQNVEVNNVLSNSFGFGGNNSTLIFSKVKS